MSSSFIVKHRLDGIATLFAATREYRLSILLLERDQEIPFLFGCYDDGIRTHGVPTTHLDQIPGEFFLLPERGQDHLAGAFGHRLLPFIHISGNHVSFDEPVLPVAFTNEFIYHFYSYRHNREKQVPLEFRVRLMEFFNEFYFFDHYFVQIFFAVYAIIFGIDDDTIYQKCKSGFCTDWSIWTVLCTQASVCAQIDCIHTLRLYKKVYIERY